MKDTQPLKRAIITEPRPTEPLEVSGTLTAHFDDEIPDDQVEAKAAYDDLVELWATDFAASITPDQLDRLAEICLDMAPSKLEIAARILREAGEGDLWRTP